MSTVGLEMHAAYHGCFQDTHGTSPCWGQACLRAEGLVPVALLYGSGQLFGPGGFNMGRALTMSASHARRA